MEDYPVKNVTWILIEIPCHFSSQIDGSLVQIHTKFHNYSMVQVSRFYLLKHDMDCRQVQVMEFPWDFLRKWWNFERIWSHFRTKLSSERREKIHVTFVRVNFSFYENNKIWVNSVKNMTWILMEIPCHFTSQIDGSLVQIGTNLHDNSISFIQVLFAFHAKTWHGF